MRSIAAVILAAGASTRMFEPKQLLTLERENLLERALRIAMEASCSPIKVVLGSTAALIQQSSKLEGADIVINAAWSTGMGSSICAGVGSLSDVDGAILMTCDMPTVTVGHLRRLMASGETTASLYAGRHGVPAYFQRQSFPELLKLQGDHGAKDMLRSADAVELELGELDVDTPYDLQRARELFMQRSE